MTDLWKRAVTVYNRKKVRKIICRLKVTEINAKENPLTGGADL